MMLTTELKEKYPLVFEALKVELEKKRTDIEKISDKSLPGVITWRNTSQGHNFWSLMSKNTPESIEKAKLLQPQLFNLEKSTTVDTYKRFVVGKWYQCLCNATISRYVGVSPTDPSKLHFDATFNPKLSNEGKWAPGMHKGDTYLALKKVYYSPSNTVDMSKYADRIADTHKHLIT